MPFHQLLDDRKAEAGTFIGVASVQALEDGEDAVGIFGVDADAVVRDRELPVSAVGFGRNLDLGRFRSPELDGVGDLWLP